MDVRTHSGSAESNLSLARTIFLEKLMNACHESVANGGSVVELERTGPITKAEEHKAAEAFRVYDDSTAVHVRWRTRV